MVHSTFLKIGLVRPYHPGDVTAELGLNLARPKRFSQKCLTRSKFNAINQDINYLFDFDLIGHHQFQPNHKAKMDINNA